ncbi:hypothetical protein B0H63DRAFT_248694 [Podospora didyma]|uniref:Uncharacterized protein n=1 Tax=Podospora didyma TaxID=330526 RepID=A0AAE0KM83_9PEZI|nr:hypothetical protein B0H63DRAFT_248694 [Podospora didyma]
MNVVNMNPIEAGLTVRHKLTSWDGIPQKLRENITRTIIAIENLEAEAAAKPLDMHNKSVRARFNQDLITIVHKELMTGMEFFACYKNGPVYEPIVVKRACELCLLHKYKYQVPVMKESLVKDVDGEESRRAAETIREYEAQYDENVDKLKFSIIDAAMATMWNNNSGENDMGNGIGAFMHEYADKCKQQETKNVDDGGAKDNLSTEKKIAEMVAAAAKFKSEEDRYLLKVSRLIAVANTSKFAEQIVDRMMLSASSDTIDLAQTVIGLY